VGRILVSLGIVVALILLSAAGPCLACSPSSPGTPSPASCCHHGGCEKPAKSHAPLSCASPVSDLATLEQSWTQMDHAVAPAFEAATQNAVVVSAVNLPPPPETHLSTLDLSLFNSVFLI
jgi:hypothetical protein